jgi:Aspartyl protease
MLKRFLGTIAVAAVAVCFAAHADDDCRLTRIAAFDIKVGYGQRVEIPAKIGSQPISLIVDTGSAHSMIAERTANALGMQQSLFPESSVSMWGGARITRYVVVDGLQLGRLLLGRSELFVIPNQYMSPDSDGLLGSDIMSRFDADFDFGNGKLNFISQDHCSGQVIYWTDPSNVAVVPFHRTPGNASFYGLDFKKILLRVTVDGKEFRAALDTGAPGTSLNLDEAESEFGLTPDSPGMEKARGGRSYRYRFKMLTFGGDNSGTVAVNNPEIILDPYPVNKMSGNAPTLLIGMNVLRQLHLYIAYREEKLYISSATATHASTQ